MNEPVRNPAFQLIAGHPLLDLVNTLGGRFRQYEAGLGGLLQSGPRDQLGSYADLLLFIEQSGLLTAKQTRQLLRATSGSASGRVLASCIELREAAADVLYSGLDGRSPSSMPLKTLARFFKDALGPQELIWKDSRLDWDWPQLEAWAELPLWLLSLSAANLMIAEEMKRVRACENPDCRLLFLDTSKNHTRRWCDMRLCGNRMKARRFKAQRRA
jgi:predicted RNA-binding Zn ribbon-like protein